MTLARTAPQRRRTPPPADRYRAVARAAGRRRRHRGLGMVLDRIALAALILVAIVVAGRAGEVAGAAGTGIAAWVGSIIPAAAAPAELTVAETTGQVSAAPVLDATPPFTKESSLLLQGAIPAFGISADRRLEVTLNGGTPQRIAFDGNGHFAIPLALNDGPNAIQVSLVTASNDVVATSARTITVLHTPPALTVASPKTGDTVDGPNVTVSGKTAAGMAVLVNDRTVIVAPDGSFSDTFTAAAGDLALTVVARDRAGNETKSQLTITVRDPAKAGTAALTVTLSKATVKPGELVTAQIFVTSGGRPVSDATVSLTVGVVAIASAKTDAAGRAQISFAAPPNEGIAQVVVLGPNVSGSATLIIAK